MSKEAKPQVSKVPAWVVSQWRAAGMCERCGQQPAATIWAGTEQEICWTCCDVKRAERSR